MDVLIGYGLTALAFAAVLLPLRGKGKKADFTNYAVGGRSFGSWFQTMSVLNTWFPGGVLIAGSGLIAGAGVIGFYTISYGLLAYLLMYLMARRVWVWAAVNDLRTQSDLFGLRYGGQSTRIVPAVIQVLTNFPWIIIGMQAMGLVFHAISFGHLSYVSSVLLGVVVLALRQIWTVRMGMRGVVITDFWQGLIAYGLGSVLLLVLVVRLVTTGHGLDAVPGHLLAIPGPGSPVGPLYLFALIFTGAVGGWCWSGMFVRLFTADGVRSVKSSAVYALPIALLFSGLLAFFALLASSAPGVAGAPDLTLFTVSGSFGGPWIITIAAIVVLMATIGNADGILQSVGTLIVNDLITPYRSLADRTQVIAAKVSISVLTLAAAGVAMVQIPNLISLAIIAYQGVAQLAVPQFLGLIWRRGNAWGAVGGMVSGFATAVVLQVLYPTSVPWLGGLTSGVAGLAVNLAVYVALAFLLVPCAEEKRRVDELFASAVRADSTREAAAGTP